MITDSIPRRAARKKEYLRSDAMRSLELPHAEHLRAATRRLEEALERESRREVERACHELASIVAEFFGVPVPPVAVLGVRPHRVSEGVCVYEKFGDYDPNTTHIRLWMRTAIHQKITSFGTLLSTLCHELCHHLDVVRLDFPNTFHTRGFYERAARLYHHARNTPLRPLVWVEQANGTFRINWAQTMSNAAPGSASN